MSEKRWAFEDLHVGQVVELGAHTVTADEIVEFASEFDPQPMHLDRAAGEASILGGLAASGWHSCAMLMRLMCDGFLNQSTSQGAPGLDYVRWLKPVLAGDILNGRVEITALRRSEKRPHIGLATVRNELTNGRGEKVVEMQNTGMFLLRNPVGVS